MGKTDITPKEMKDVISGKLSRYFGVSIKEASTEQLYKAVVMCGERYSFGKKKRLPLQNQSGKGKESLLSLHGIFARAFAKKQRL